MPEFEGFAVLELMDHTRLAGYVREVEVAGVPMLKVDSYKLNGSCAIKYINPLAVCAITSVDEETVKKLSVFSGDIPLYVFSACDHEGL
ncbi:MAG: hypothetical protein HQK55_15110 [Deltaproteobacteria bacterium]|nr:hypothetical protein [Deltaproteobacteria bacterium]